MYLDIMVGLMIVLTIILSFSAFQDQFFTSMEGLGDQYELTVPIRVMGLDGE